MKFCTACSTRVLVALDGGEFCPHGHSGPFVDEQPPEPVRIQLAENPEFNDRWARAMQQGQA